MNSARFSSVAREAFSADEEIAPLAEGSPWARVSVEVAFNHDYSSDAPRLRSLYEKSKRSQWNAATDIDWDLAVEFGAPLPYAPGAEDFLDGSADAEMWNRFRWEFQAWMVSQFLHGEQGALIGTARLVEMIPHADARLYAASQVADEARHVEVFARYLTQKLGHAYPIDPSLDALLRNIMSDSRWDIVCLGMQVIIEGLALAAFRLGDVAFSDPLIRQITARVARDEARHVAFGDLALHGYYDQLTSADLRDREEFVCEAVLLMGRRFRLGDVWDRLEIDRSAGIAFAATNERMIASRQVLFGKIVASLSKLGLLTPRVRQHLRDMALLPSR